MYRVSPRQYYFNDKKSRTHKLKAENIFSDKNDPLELKLLLFALRHEKFFLYLQIVGLVVNIFAFVYCTRGKFLIYYQTQEFKNDAALVIHVVSDFLLMAVTVSGTIGFSKKNFFVDLLTFILKKKSGSARKKSSSFRRYVNILRFEPLIPVVSSTYFFAFQVGWSVEQYFIPRDIWYYLLNLQICSATILAFTTKETFNYFNDSLEKLVKNDSISFVTAEVSIELQLSNNRLVKTRSKLEDLKDLTSNYTILCNLLDNLNRYTKIMLVLVIMSITINILFNVTVIVEYALKPTDIVGGETKITVLVLQTMLAVASMGQAAGLAFVGESLEEEGQRTSWICYTLLNKLDRNVKTDYDKQIIKEVGLLLDLSKSRKIYLHAGGFFKLNWGILGSIISTVATYSIVIIQFLLK